MILDKADLPILTSSTYADASRLGADRVKYYDVVDSFGEKNFVGWLKSVNLFRFCIVLINTSSKCRVASPFLDDRLLSAFSLAIGGDMDRKTSIHRTLRAHEIAAPWEHQVVASVCYRAFDLFNKAFFDDDMPPCLLEFISANFKRDGASCVETNGIGVRSVIQLNTRRLSRPLYEVLGTVLHQMIHQWLNQQGHTANRTYHKREFIEKSKAVGIPARPHDRCCTPADHTDPFLTVVNKLHQDLNAPAEPDALPVAISGRSPYKKWSCGCTNIRVAKAKFSATCRDCGSLFVQQPARTKRQSQTAHNAAPSTEPRIA